MPKRVLVIGDSMSLAHAVRAMVVARRLAAEGAEVIYATGTAHQELARREGFDPRQVHCVDPAEAMRAIRSGSNIFADVAVLERCVESDLALIDAVKPELIVHDFRMSLNISAERVGVEYWSIMNAYATHHYAAKMNPPRTMRPVRVMGRTLSGLLFPMLKRMTLRGYAASFRELRRRFGLPATVRDIFDVIESPARNLVADVPQFMPMRDAPANFEYIGPLVWEPRMPAPDWLDDVDESRPTAYVSMGSTGGAGDFARVLRVLRDAGWQVMTTTGSQVEAPAGVFAAKMAPGSALLQKADVLVCHGGSGTIYQAIGEGVPVVAIPTFHDQEINADRLGAVGWGVGLDPVRWTDRDLLGAVEASASAEAAVSVGAGRTVVRDAVARSIARGLSRR